MSNRRASVGRLSARRQSSYGPPVMDFVSVAVLPPRLPSDMAPPTGITMAEAISWDESVNWKHNDAIEEREQPATRRKSFMRKAGITTQRKKLIEDTPPFIFKQVPYDTWRKHYAKDKDGRYHGTLAPAEDCLLMPEDVMKWRLEEPKTKADLWTRGKIALPVYAEAEQNNDLPAYSENYDGPPVEEPRLQSVSSSESPGEASTSGFTADGKTAEQIIKEAEEKARVKKTRKESWKHMLKRGTEFTMG